MSKTVRVGTATTRAKAIDYRISAPSEALAAVDESLDRLEEIARSAAEKGCDVIAFNEDSLGLLKWEAAHWEDADKVLPKAVEKMLERLGRAAAAHNMYVVCCSDTLEADGGIYNTAYLIGRDGKEIGRYHKVNLAWHERLRAQGDRFPVFETPDLGAVGLLICYDMIFPEAARCLALAGADIIFHPTLGGAAFGGHENSRAAFRTRAVENFVYIVVAWGGTGSMIVSPRAEVLADGKDGGDLVFADIDPFGGRQGEDAVDHNEDMRARLFRERCPAAYGILTDPSPPALKKLPEMRPAEETARIAAGALTYGEDAFLAAQGRAKNGKTKEAIEEFTRLIAEYPGTWIDRASRDRIRKLGEEK